MFNKTKFLGTWYEAERYFTVTELASKCIAVTYENRPDGKIWVNNAITNRL
jgi:apolipoprotein D and lipocalin family protein